MDAAGGVALQHRVGAQKPRWIVISFPGRRAKTTLDRYFALDRYFVRADLPKCVHPKRPIRSPRDC
jgi:hypothetical protein